MRNWYFGFVLLFSGFCGKESKLKEVSFFIMPEYKDGFAVSINDGEEITSIKHNTREHGPQELIAKMSLHTDSMKIRLRILDRDTIFYYNFSRVDSLFLGLTIKNDAIVVQNEDEYIHYYD